MDLLSEGDTTEQVMEDVFKEKKDDRDEEEARANQEGEEYEESEAKDECGKEVDKEVKIPKEEEDAKANEKVPKKKTWINWLKNELRGSNNLQTEVYLNTKKAAGTKPAKDPDEVDSRPDKKCVERLDRAAKTKDKELLECPHLFHNMK